jgi:hypothetical protein
LKFERLSCHVLVRKGRKERLQTKGGATKRKGKLAHLLHIQYRPQTFLDSISTRSSLQHGQTMALSMTFAKPSLLALESQILSSVCPCHLMNRRSRLGADKHPGGVQSPNRPPCHDSERFNGQCSTILVLFRGVALKERRWRTMGRYVIVRLPLPSISPCQTEPGQVTMHPKLFKITLFTLMHAYAHIAI